MMIRKLFVTAVLPITAVIGVCSGRVMISAASMEVPRISVEQTKEMLGRPDVVIIDVRATKTWWKSTTKILHAVREEAGSVEKRVEKYPKYKTLILYCS